MSIVAPSLVRLSGGVFAAAFASVAIATGGLASFGEVSVVLVTNAVTGIVGAGGLGLWILSLSADERPQTAVEGVRLAPRRLLASMSLAVMSMVLVVGLLSSLSPVAIAFAALHTVATATTVVMSQLYRSQERNLLADLFLGRQGGPLALAGAILSALCWSQFIGELEPFHLVSSIAIGSSVAAISSLVGHLVIGRRKRALEQSLITRPSLANQARLAVSAAVGPLIAATPIWVASRTLEEDLVGLLALGGQIAAVVGLLAGAAQSRFLGQLGGSLLRRDDPAMQELALVHGRARKVIRPLGVIVWAGLVGFLFVLFFRGWPVLEVGLVASLPIAQASNLVTGLAGAQVQLGGFPSVVTRVGLLRASINVAGGVLASVSSPILLPISVAAAGMVAPFLLAGFLHSRSGINPLPIGRQFSTKS